MAFELPPLPYSRDALAPHMSEQTLDFHYGKHHQTYVTTLNDLVKGTPQENQSLEEVILGAEPGKVFNNAGQVWNHTFYWNSMTPGGGGEPDAALKSAIEAKYGSLGDFQSTWVDQCKGLFGSGWVWLVKDGDGVDIVQTKNADLPLKHGQTALITIDVWEHAYYLDYQNARPAFAEAWLANLVNWEFASSNFAKG
jgi:superoxide dismutase, Fe-Mn family